MEERNYPVVEARELLPSFDSDMWEDTRLPGFSLVAFARTLKYFSEVFQYDILHPVHGSNLYNGVCCPLEQNIVSQNLQTICDRLPRMLQEEVKESFAHIDTTIIDFYPALLPYLLHMDRAHVLSRDADGLFHLAGVFASFPSDIDSEIKRFGLRIGKFKAGNDELYERNRMFVYNYLMELYGFPIVSERRTSSALFARKLHRMGEPFLIRVLGQTDRALTTYWSNAEKTPYPHLEKIALVALDNDQEEVIRAVREGGFFLDAEKRVVILRVRYNQHSYDPKNIRRNRALSVSAQEILHPLTGKKLTGFNIIKDANNMLLRLNDIVRGEHNGSIIYKRTERIENTDTDEKKLKFLYAWLTKHQHRIINYSDDFFSDISRIVSAYLHAPEHDDIFQTFRELHRETNSRFSYILQARKVRTLDDLRHGFHKGNRIPRHQMMQETIILLQELRFEIVNFFPELVESAILAIEAILADRYLIRNYIEAPEEKLSSKGKEIRKNYGRLVSLLDGFKAVRKARSAI